MEKLSRKDFLSNASKAAVGLAAVGGLSSIVTTASLKAGSKVTPWPWPYTQLDPEAIRIQAHYLYWNDKDCASGTFGAIVQALATAIGDPWTNMPIETLLYGRGGGAGWGTLCGCLNGGAAIISLVTTKSQSTPLITELWGWYNSAMLPTDQANQVAVNGQYLVHNYDQALPQNISGSPLCHISVTEWCILAQKKVSDVERKERCARITGDVTAKVVELLNAHFAGTFVPTYVDPATVTACMGCHGSAVLNNVMTKMECTSCHGDNPHPNSVEQIDPVANSFELYQNYPNPFNPSTKIRYSISKPEKVTVGIYDIQGSLIKVLVDHELQSPGVYETVWDGTDFTGAKVASGIYFSRLESDSFMKTIKMSLVK
jgi:hypothetical protein